MRNRVPMTVLGGALCALLLFNLASAAPGAESPVADAAMMGDVDTVRALLREGADVNAAQGDGMTALHWAAMKGDVDTINLLVYAGATMDPLTRLGAYTPTHLASAEGHGDTVALLVSAGANPSAATETGVQPIHLAAQAGSVVALEALIERGAEIDVKDGTHGRTPLIFATSQNRVEAIEVLLANGADVFMATNIIDYVERSRLDGQSRQTRQRVVDAQTGRTSRGRGGPPQLNQAQQQQQQQAQRGARGAAQADPPDPDDPPARGGRGANAQADPPDPDTPPARGGRAAAASRGGDGNDQPRPRPNPNVPRSLSNTEQIGRQGGFAAIHYAAREGFAEAAEMLFNAGTDVDLLTTGDGSSPMLVAVINGNFDMAKDMLDRGANPNLASDDGASPLFAVVNQEWHLRTWYPQPTANEQQEISYLELMEALLDAGADPNARTKSHIWYAAYNAGRMGVDFTGATAFWRAAYSLDVEAMRLLVAKGADPHMATLKLQGRRGFFDLNQAFPARAGEPEPEMDPSGLPEVPPGGPHVSPLHAATGVGFGTSRVAQQHRSIPEGWLPAAKYLIEEIGIDVNVRDADGFTPLHNAAARGDNEMVLYLLEVGADPMVVSRRGHTTVDMANSPEQRTQPYPETIALLERFGAINNHNCRACD